MCYGLQGDFAGALQIWMLGGTSGMGVGACRLMAPFDGVICASDYIGKKLDEALLE